MKNFAVIPSPTSKFSAVVLSTGVELPQTHLDGLIDELRKHEVCGEVIFDLLTSNGSRTRRFFSSNFDGEKFLKTPLFSQVCPEDEVRKASARYLRDHLPDFDLSLLTPAMRFAVQRGIPL